MTYFPKHPLIILLHGGESISRTRTELFDLPGIDALRTNAVSFGWYEHFCMRLRLSAKVWRPSMPVPFDAAYEEWKTLLDHLLQLIDRRTPVHLIGHSLGATCAQQYFSQEAKKLCSLQSIHLIAPTRKEGSFALSENIGTFEAASSKIHLWHSTDDEVVPFSDSLWLFERLRNAQFHKFSDRGHFTDLAFVELEEWILRETSTS